MQISVTKTYIWLGCQSSKSFLFEHFLNHCWQNEYKNVLHLGNVMICNFRLVTKVNNMLMNIILAIYVCTWHSAYQFIVYTLYERFFCIIYIFDILYMVNSFNFYIIFSEQFSTFLDYNMLGVICVLCTSFF